MFLIICYMFNVTPEGKVKKKRRKVSPANFGEEKEEDERRAYVKTVCDSSTNSDSKSDID